MLWLGGQMCHLHREDKFCPIDRKKETHLHFLRGCLTSSVMFDLVRQSFGVVQTKDGSAGEPSRLVVDAPVLSLGTTQGLLVWARLRAQWVLRCAKRFRGEAYSKEIFIAKWLSICRSWQRQNEISLSRRDLWHFVSVLESWSQPSSSIEHKVPRPVITPPSKQQQGAHKKQRLAEDREIFEEVFMGKQKGGWDVLFTDGSSKIAYQELGLVWSLVRGEG